MISNFQDFTEDGIYLKVNLGVDGYHHEGNSESDIAAFYKSKNKGITWENDDKKIKMIEKGFYLSGLPTPDMQKVVVVHSGEHPVYPAPSNAVIYNADGSFYKQLTVPRLVSDMAKSRRNILYKGDYPGVVHFRSVHWEKNAALNIVLSVDITFDLFYYEARVLHAETGEFGECTGSGMH